MTKNISYENTSLVQLPGSRLYKRDIRVGTLTLSDVQEIALIRETTDENKLYDIIDRKLQGITVDELTNQDLEYLLHWQRVNSYPHFPIEIKWNCPKCSESNHSQISGPDLVINEITEDFEDYAEVRLFSREEPVKIRLSTIGDSKESRKYMVAKGIDPDDTNFRSKIGLALTLEPTGGSVEERLKLVESFTADDYVILKELESMLDYGVKPYVKKECFSCNAKIDVSYKFNLAKFFPPFPSGGDLRGRILLNQTSSAKCGGDGLLESSVATEPTPERPARTRKTKEPEAQQVRVAKFGEIVT